MCITLRVIYWKYYDFIFFYDVAKSMRQVYLGVRPLRHVSWIPTPLRVLQNQEWMFLVFLFLFLCLVPMLSNIGFLSEDGCALVKGAKKCASWSYRMKKYGQYLGSIGHSLLACMFLPVSRRSIVVIVTGLSYEKLLKWHHICGRLMFVFVVLHTLGFVVNWVSSGVVLGKIFKSKILAGIFCFVALSLLNICSLERNRENHYRLFRIVHVVFVPCVLMLLFLHYDPQELMIKLSMPLGFYVVDLYRRRKNLTEGVVNSIKLVGGDVAKVEIACDNIVSNVGSCDWIYINIPLISKFEIHPFSLFHGVQLQDLSSRPVLFIYMKVKDQNSWTNRLVQDKSILRNSSVYIDGPYGSLGLKMELKKYDVLLIICGGVGVVPLLSLVRNCSNTLPCVFVWTCNNSELIREFSSEILACSAFDSVSVTVCYTGHDSGSSALSGSRVNFSTGKRVNLADTMSDVLHVHRGHGAPIIGSITCGPKSLSDDVQTHLAGLNAVFHHYEEVYQV